MTLLWYILTYFIVPYKRDSGDNFILMDGNFRPHSVGLVNDFHKERGDWANDLDIMVSGHEHNWTFFRYSKNARSCPLIASTTGTTAWNLCSWGEECNTAVLKNIYAFIRMTLNISKNIDWIYLNFIQNPLQAYAVPCKDLFLLHIFIFIKK